MMLAPRRYAIFEKAPLIQALSTRPGGVSAPPYHHLNLGLRTGDDPENVWANRRKFFNHFGLDIERAVWPSQVHKDYIHVALEPGVIIDCDAVITRVSGLTLTVQAADCAPVFIYDPRNHACGVVHSGWRGTVKQIVYKTIRRMQKVFGSAPETLLVAVGAAIRQPHYQVDETTAAHFDGAFLEEDGSGHYLLDVTGAIVRQLQNAGVDPVHIEVDPLSTYDHPDLFYSYRRDGSKSGRMMGLLCLL
ncbi:MAG: peptidoglycan editing factor PgeF [Calditrichaeota bacterium]|nr:MAG: peptidoglycan editing factor PgeF [Calditrichota bacterium]